ncbi:MAG: hypothetical protein SFV54_14720 [Bryobacteraceae bacterium]|nr:hypothetical protein [Bryobacteraceae bacterium]
MSHHCSVLRLAEDASLWTALRYRIARFLRLTRRDPSVDPQPGDILRLPGFPMIEVIERSETDILASWTDSGNPDWPTRQRHSLATWRELMRPSEPSS